MPSTARELIDRAQKTLCDPNEKHWDSDELLCYLNEAICELAGARPDQFIERRDIPLKPGTCQVVPAGCIDLVDIEANIKDGEKTEDAVIKDTGDSGSRLGNKYVCRDMEMPDGQEGSPDPCEGYIVEGFKITAIAHGCFDVEPPVPAECTGDNAVTVAALVYCEPTKATSLDDECLVPGIFEAQVVNWILMRAFEKDIESQYAQSRASYYRNNFYSGVNADYRAASRLRSGYILGQEGTGNEQTGWRNEIRGVYG